jgi:hypothetical protein
MVTFLFGSHLSPAYEVNGVLIVIYKIAQHHRWVEQKNKRPWGHIVPSQIDPRDQLTTVANLETGHNCTMFEN